MNSQSRTEPQRKISHSYATPGWSAFSKEKSRYPLKYNSHLFDLGILSIAYRNDENLQHLVHDNNFHLGSRKLSFHTYKECNIYAMSINSNEKKVELYLLLKEVLNQLLENVNDPIYFIIEKVNQLLKDVSPIYFIREKLNQLLEDVSAIYVITDDGFFFVNKTPDQEPAIIKLNVTEDALYNLQTKLWNGSTASQVNRYTNHDPILLYEKPSIQDYPLKVINSLTGHQVNRILPPTKQEKILNWVSTYSKQKLSYDKNTFIINSARRDEVFLPVAITNDDESKIGFYIYPWTSEKVTFNKYHDFVTYVTAGCMFGSYLKGHDEKFETKKSLIKHDTIFTGQEKITDVECEATVNPYEEIIFYDFEKLLQFIKAASQKQKEVNLLYHLPSVDYMLFGIKLFYDGRMTLDALNSLFDEILKEKYIYEERLYKIIFSLNLQDKIKISILSPFSALLGLININEPHSATALLRELGVEIELADYSSFSEQERTQYSTEKQIRLVEACTKLLCDKQFMQEQNCETTQIAWVDLIAADHAIQKKKAASTNKTSPVKETCPIENLLTIGNIVIQNMAAYKAQPNSVCSFLPLSEKQIQSSYKMYQQEIKKNKDKQQNYIPLINFTYLDSVITYGPKQTAESTSTLGLAYYFNHPSPKELNNILVKSADAKNSNLKQASINLNTHAKRKNSITTIGLFQKPIDITETTPNPESPEIQSQSSSLNI